MATYTETAEAILAALTRIEAKLDQMTSGGTIEATAGEVEALLERIAVAVERSSLSYTESGTIDGQPFEISGTRNAT